MRWIAGDEKENRGKKAEQSLFQIVKGDVRGKGKIWKINLIVFNSDE